MTTRPDLSVVMPLYNSAEWVEEAVRSVLAGAEGLLELIVVNDGSTDSGRELVASIDGPITIIDQTNAGPSAARNTGVAAARGPLIGFLDADDIWRATAPDQRRAAIADGAELAFGRVEFVAGNPPKPFGRKAHLVNVGSLLVTRGAFDRIGDFDESLEQGEDADWVLRARDLQVPAAYVEQTALTYRLRKGSLTRDVASSQEGLLTAIHRSLGRRDKAGGGQ